MTIQNKYGFTLHLSGDTQLLTDDTIEKLKDYDDTIFWNDSKCEHWMFDFKINDVWFEVREIDMSKQVMKINAFQ